MFIIFFLKWRLWSYREVNTFVQAPTARKWQSPFLNPSSLTPRPTLLITALLEITTLKQKIWVPSTLYSLSTPTVNIMLLNHIFNIEQFVLKIFKERNQSLYKQCLYISINITVRKVRKLHLRVLPLNTYLNQSSFKMRTMNNLTMIMQKGIRKH